MPTDMTIRMPYKIALAVTAALLTAIGGMVLTGIENKYLYPSISGDAVTGGMALTGIENKYLYPGISGDAVTDGMALTGITMEEV